MDKRTDKSLNAELKHLRLRIEKLEQNVLKAKTDSGKITDEVKDISKG